MTGKQKPLALVVALSLAAAVTGCGGSDEEDPQGTVGKAADAILRAKTATVSVTGSLRRPGGRAEWKYTASGQIDYRRRRGSFELEPLKLSRQAGLRSEDVRGQVLLSPRAAYLRSPALVREFGLERARWLRIDLRGKLDQKGIDLMPVAELINAVAALRRLRATRAEVERLGEQHVRGSETTRYRTRVRRGNRRRSVSATADIWIDRDGLIRRIEERYHWGPQRFRLTARQRVEFLALGVPVEDRVPSGDAAIGPTAASVADGLRRAKSFRRHRLYYLGRSFAGLPLTSVNGLPGQPFPRAPAINFIYGGCTPPPGRQGGCPPTVSIQLWSVCDRSPVMIDLPFTRLVRRSVPTAGFGDRLELYAGDVTVVIFAERRLAERAARALRSLDGTIGAGESLPQPLSGVVSGRAQGCPLDLTEASSYKKLRLFHLGRSFEGLGLTQVLGLPGSTQMGPRPGGPIVTFHYRACSRDWGPRARCMRPLQINVARLCRPRRGGHTASGRSRLRGVPAHAVGPDGPLVLETGDARVTVSATPLARARRAARTLRSADGKIGPGEALPPPRAAPC